VPTIGDGRVNPAIPTSRVINVHLRGYLEGRTWLLDNVPFGFYEALHRLTQEWGYCGLLTMEPNRLQAGDLGNLVGAMASLSSLA
jgi:hypothetical protein